MIPTSYGQVTFIFTGTAVPQGAVTTIGFGNELGGSPTLCAEEFRTNWLDNMKGTYSSSVVLSEVEVKLGPDATGPSASVSVTGGAGTLAAACAPPNVASLWIKNTATGGRRGKGRMFVPGVPEATVDAAGNIDPAQLPFWQTAATAFFDDAITGQVPLYLLHDPGTQWALVGGKPRRIPNGEPSPAPSPLTGITPAPVAATQRRRMR